MGLGQSWLHDGYKLIPQSWMVSMGLSTFTS